MTAKPTELLDERTHGGATATARLTVHEGIAALNRGKLTCEAWVQACLERIEQRNPAVRAWVHVAANAALGRARSYDREGRKRLFDGVPIGIKDTIDTFDMPTELGDPDIFPGRQPSADAPVVHMARDLGFIPLGKNTVSKHAIMLPGPCRNPHDLTRTPGASSAGSAAAAADFMVPLSIGTQTAGSILRPASFCGAVGFKPTLDAIPYVGIRRYSRPLDVVGPLCRAVEDVQLFMWGFMGDPRFKPVTVEHARAGSLTLGVWRPRMWGSAEPESQALFEENIRRLGVSGVTLIDLSMPQEFDSIGDHQDIVMAYDLAKEYAQIKRDHADLCDRELIEYLELGEGYSDSDYISALDAADKCRRLFFTAARGVDALVTPATLGEAPAAATTGSSIFIRPWSLLHNPSISLPVSRSVGGLPIGIQLVGWPQEDSALLHYARRVEKILGNCACGWEG